jgi:hypothetical protein
MPGIEIHQAPEGVETRVAPLAATQTFTHCDPVYLVANALTESPADGTEVLVAEAIGMAATNATDTTAGSRATAVADGFGAVTSSSRCYYPVHAAGIEYRTRNFWATGAAGTLAVPVAGDIGGEYQISNDSATTGLWGVEETAGVAGTDLVAHIIQVLDANMRPIGESGEAGVWVVFHVSGSTLTQDIGG